MRIDIPMFDLAEHRISQKVAHYVAPDGEYCEYHIEAYVIEVANLKEEQYEDKEKYIWYHTTFTRAAVAAIDLDFSPHDSEEQYDTWCIELWINGMSTRIRLKFETQQQATPIHKQLLGWWKTGKVPEMVKG